MAIKDTTKPVARIIKTMASTFFIIGIASRYDKVKKLAAIST
jgi:hypothetical protein